MVVEQKSIMEEKEIEDLLLKINGSYGFIIRNKYQWTKPFINGKLFTMRGYSIVDLIRDEQIPFFKKWSLIDIGYDYIKVKVSENKKFEVIVFSEDDIEKDFIEIIPLILTISS
jgi:hypothetical protein